MNKPGVWIQLRLTQPIRKQASPAGDVQWRHQTMHPISRVVLVIVLVCGLLRNGAPADLKFVLIKREVVESRLKSFSRIDTERESILKTMFGEAGCAEHVSEFQVKH